jgi:hypothetical protein
LAAALSGPPTAAGRWCTDSSPTPSRAARPRCSHALPPRHEPGQSMALQETDKLAGSASCRKASKPSKPLTEQSKPSGWRAPDRNLVLLGSESSPDADRVALVSGRPGRPRVRRRDQATPCRRAAAPLLTRDRIDHGLEDHAHVLDLGPVVEHHPRPAHHRQFGGSVIETTRGRSSVPNAWSTHPAAVSVPQPWPGGWSRRRSMKVHETVARPSKALALSSRTTGSNGLTKKSSAPTRRAASTSAET